MERAVRRRVIVRVSVLFAAGMLAWAAFWSPMFDLRRVLVVGGSHTTSEQVARIADLTGDENILLLSTSEVAVRAERLPWVKDVRVERILPGTVRVRVVERNPALAISLGAARWTIDAHGRVLQSGIAERGLPTLVGIDAAAIEPGVELTTREARSALVVWRGLPRRLRADVAAVFAPTIERISLSLEDGTLIRYGAAERMTAKNEVVTALMHRLAGSARRVTYIDVRVPTRPAVSGARPSGTRPPPPGAATDSPG